MTSIRQGHGLAPGDRLLLAMLVVLILGASTVFLRTTMMPFYIPQLTFFWVVAVAVWFIGVYRVAVSGTLDRGPRPLAAASVAFISALIVTSVMSPQPWVALTGLPARGGGAFFYLLCLGLLYASFGLTRRRSARPLLLAFVATHGLVVFYALLQGYGLDPISWGSDASQVGTLIFSTLGNSNFASGYVGLTLPLLVWVTFGSPYPAVTKTIAGAAIGASVVALVYLNSFQGQASALAASVVLVQWAMTRGRSQRLLAVLIVSPVGAAIVGLPFVFSAPGGSALFTVMAGLAACAFAGARHDSRRATSTNGEFVKESGGWFWSTTAAVLGASALVGLLFWSRIVAQLESGLEQRFEFWKVSLSIFRDSPLVGKGLETYLTYFTTHRSVDQAVKWELLLSNSPHSEPIGMLSGGGLVLLGAYLAILVVVGFFGVRAVRRAEGSSQLFYGAVFAAWVAYQVQASVAVGATGVIYTQWVLGGVLVAGGSSSVLPSRELPWKPRVGRRAGQGNGAPGLRRLITGCALAGAFFFSLGPLSAPLRANMAVHRAQLALARADPAAAEDELAQAIRLEPRNGYYAESMAFLYEQGGFQEAAFAEIDRGARLQRGIPYIALKAAGSAVAVDRLDSAEGWYEHAVDSDPNGVTAIAEAAAFHARTGRPDRAADLLESFERLRSPRMGSWKTAADAYEYLGAKDYAAHLRRCSDPWWEEVGCFDDLMMQD